MGRRPSFQRKRAATSILTPGTAAGPSVSPEGTTVLARYDPVAGSGSRCTSTVASASFAIQCSEMPARV